MEFLDIVDENGTPTGEIIDRDVAHKRGVRHRTSHVWMLKRHKGKVQVLLQKRSRGKDSYPGCYDISSAGHIPAGDGFLESALRELKEELGIKAKKDELIFCGQRRFEFRETFHGEEFWDNQVSNVYVLWKDVLASKLTIQKSEVDTVSWMDWDECIDMVKHKKSPNCIWITELEMIASSVNGVNTGFIEPGSL